MNGKEKEVLELLIKQRDQLVNDIYNFVGYQQKLYIAIFSFVGLAVSLIFQLDKELAPEVVFIVIIIFFLLAFLMYGILTAMNNDRDYIRAIDTYVSEKYNIDCLFYQGHLSYLHINKSSPFSTYTTIGGIVVAVFVALFSVFGIQSYLVNVHKLTVSDILRDYIFFIIIILVESIILLGLVGSNFKYKKTGESIFYAECLEFLRSGNYNFSYSKTNSAHQQRGTADKKEFIVQVLELHSDD